jgi:hypothetical protein
MVPPAPTAHPSLVEAMETLVSASLVGLGTFDHWPPVRCTIVPPATTAHPSLAESSATLVSYDLVGLFTTNQWAYPVVAHPPTVATSAISSSTAAIMHVAVGRIRWCGILPPGYAGTASAATTPSASVWMLTICT